MMTVASMWMNFLTIPEIFSLRLLNKAYDDFIMNGLCLCDITLEPHLVRGSSTQEAPLTSKSHPLYRLLIRSSGALRSLVYRPDLSNNPPFNRRPLAFLSLKRSYAVQFTQPRGLEQFRMHMPLIPFEFMMMLLPKCRYSIEYLDVLISCHAAPGETSLTPAERMEFPRLSHLSIVLCPPVRLYRTRPMTPLTTLFMSAHLPLLQRARISGQDPKLAAMFIQRGVTVQLYEPQLRHLSQLRQLIRASRAAKSCSLLKDAWEIGEIYGLRLYYILEMLRCLGSCASSRIDRVVLAVGADQLSLLIPHLMHLERNMVTPPVSLRSRQREWTQMTTLEGGADLTVDRSHDPEGYGTLGVNEVLVVRDELSAPLFLGTVDQFAIDVVEIHQSADEGCAALSRLRDDHDRVLQYHHRHFLEGTWMPHVFLHNIT